MREILSNGMDGAIMVVDNSRGIRETDLKIIQNLNSTNVPYVVFSNKQDINCSEIDSKHIGDNVIVIPTTAKTGEGIKEGVETLLKLIKK